MSDDTPLPEMQQQYLDGDALESLVRDLGQCAQVLEVRGKATARTHALAETLALNEAIASLRQGQLRGVQIHYLFQGHLWLDTLLLTPDGIRLTRLSLGPPA